MSAQEFSGGRSTPSWGLRWLVAALLIGPALTAGAVSGGGFGGPASPAFPSSPAPGSSALPPLAVQAPSGGGAIDLGLSPGAGLALLGVVGAALLAWWARDTWQAYRRAPRAVCVQLLVKDGEALKDTLRRLARQHDPDVPDALCRALRDVAHALLARPETWAFGTLRVVRSRGRAGAERAVRRWAVQARAAFDTQTTSQYPDGDPRRGFVSMSSARSSGHGTYLAVTLAVSIHDVALRPFPAGRAGVHEVLRLLTTAVSAQTGQIEVVWSPDGPGELLTDDQATARYPDLVPIQAEQTPGRT